MTQQTVKITPEQAALSDKLKKEKVRRTIQQQHVYRAAQNIFFVLAQLRKTCPVKYRAVLEPAYVECTNVLVALSIAYADQYARITQLTLASARIDAVKTIVSILRSLGCVSKDDSKKLKSLITQCAQQILAWRASSMVRVAQGSSQVV